MRAKNVEFEVTYLERGNKPDWFLEISPHGKVPVLKVDDEVLFESNAIAEYLDEVVEPRLHPEDPVDRARHRAWTDFTPDFSRALGKFNYAKTEEAQADALEALPKTLAKLEEALSKRDNDGPYFSGAELCLVDAAYAPFLQRFGIVENLVRSGVLDGFPKLKAWSAALMENECVVNSVAAEFGAVFADNLKRREALAAGLLDQSAAAE